MQRHIFSTVASTAFVVSVYSFGSWVQNVMFEDAVLHADARADRPDRIIPDHQFPLEADVGRAFQVSAILGVLIGSPLGNPAALPTEVLAPYRTARR